VIEVKLPATGPSIFHGSTTGPSILHIKDYIGFMSNGEGLLLAEKGRRWAR
jgi:hypothetical protein